MARGSWTNQLKESKEPPWALGLCHEALECQSPWVFSNLPGRLQVWVWVKKRVGTVGTPKSNDLSSFYQGNNFFYRSLCQTHPNWHFQRGSRGLSTNRKLLRQGGAAAVALRPSAISKAVAPCRCRCQSTTFEHRGSPGLDNFSPFLQDLGCNSFHFLASSWTLSASLFSVMPLVLQLRCHFRKAMQNLAFIIHPHRKVFGSRQLLAQSTVDALHEQIMNMEG
jgi:hypothetical protein